MSTPIATVRTVSAALADVARWRADEEARAKAEMVEVEQEIRNLQTAIQNLQSQLEALHRFSADLETKKKGLAESEMKRAHAEVLQAIQAQSKALGMRDTLVGQARSAADAALSEKLRSPEYASIVEEYRQFRTTVEPTIGALPESYRKVMMAHHEGVTKRLREIVEVATSQPVSVDAPDLPVEIVWGVDLVDGAPELLVCVLPLSEQVHAHWSDTVEGVQSWLAARVVQGVYEAANLTGFARVQALTGGHEGLLVVEVDLNGASPAFPDAFGKRLAELLPRAPELVGARVVATPVRVEMDVLLPPQGEEETDAG